MENFISLVTFDKDILHHNISLKEKINLHQIWKIYFYIENRNLSFKKKKKSFR